MDSIVQAGRIYYQNASRLEKDQISTMFKRLDVDEDGRISKAELINLMKNTMPMVKILSLFTKLDRDRSGFLDFHEYVTFHYASNSGLVCNCCNEFVMGLYYCCIGCWKMHLSDGDGQHQVFEVCTKCYSERSFEHEHNEFLDNYVLFRSKEILVLNREKTVKDNLIEAAFNAGCLYYQALSGIEMNVADALFKEMDGDGDGRVSVNEVISFITKKGISQAEASKAFEDINLAGDHYLSFEDVVALWYIFVVLPRCDRCLAMIMGLYYSCVECHNMSENGTDTDPCDLCPECYSSREFEHEHGLFLDNFVLLRMKNQLPGESTATSPNGGAQGTQVARRSSMRRLLKYIVKVAVETCASAAVTSVCSIM